MKTFLADKIAVAQTPKDVFKGLTIEQVNLLTALQLGYIDWFQFLESWRKLS